MQHNIGVKIEELLVIWDTGYVNLNRNNGLFKFDNVRLRNCQLNYSEMSNSYFLHYSDVTFGLFDIEIIKE